MCNHFNKKNISTKKAEVCLCVCVCGGGGGNYNYGMKWGENVGGNWKVILKIEFCL